MFKKLKNFIDLIISIIVLLFFVVMIISVLDFFDIITLPEMLSLKNILHNNEFIIETVTELDSENIVDTNNRKIVVVKNKKDENSIYVNSEEYTQYLNTINENNNIQSDEEVDENIDESKQSSILNSRADEFYYNQLSDYAKQIYISLYNNKEKLRDGLYTIDYDLQFNDLLNTENGYNDFKDSFDLAINALVFDDPELFFLNLKKMYMLVETYTYSVGNRKEYKVKIGANDGDAYLNSGFYDKASVDEAVEELRDIRWEIIQNAEMYSNTKDKIKYVHDYLVNNVSYDKTKNLPNVHNVYGALVQREAVCEGYAKAFKYILDGMDIPCLVACGVAENTDGEREDHAWNYVQLNGKWYAVDVTWDDPILIGGGELPDDVRYSYFLKGRSNFFSNHKEDGLIVGEKYPFKYPVLNLTDY